MNVKYHLKFSIQKIEKGLYTGYQKERERLRELQTFCYARFLVTYMNQGCIRRGDRCDRGRT